MSLTSDQTGASPPVANSTLSPEAAEFVPVQRTQNDALKDSKAQQDGKGSRSLEEVPRYLTTCYPFVNPNTIQRVRAGGDNSGVAVGGVARIVGANAFGGTVRHPHLAAFPPHQQIGLHPSSHPAAPHHSWLPGLLPGPPFTPPFSLRPLAPGVHHIPFDGGTAPTAGGLGGSGGGGGGGRGLLPTPPPPAVSSAKGNGLLPTPPYPPIISNPAAAATAAAAPATVLAPTTVVMQYPPNVVAPQVFLPGDGTGRLVPAAIVPRVRQGQASVGHSANVSRGTQKEASVMAPGGRSHTLIMKDNSVQTDFHTDISELTLQEKASPLYHRGQRRNQASQPDSNQSGLVSTDSEEVDSDSGYSSPLHRRNLVSNGTHPVRMSFLPETGTASERLVRAKGSLRVGPGSAGSALQSKGADSVVGILNRDGVSGGGANVSRGKDASVSTSAMWGNTTTVTATSLSEHLGVQAVSLKELTKKEESASKAKPKTGAAAVAEALNAAVAAKKAAAAAAAAAAKKAAASAALSAVAAVTTVAAAVGSAVTTMPQSVATTTTPAPSEAPALTSTPVPSLAPSKQDSKVVAMETTPTSATTTKTSSASSSPSSRHSRSPASSRRAATPCPLLIPVDFPILKPAKRNEPPWSLTPSKSKKGGEGGGAGVGSGGFLGMMADSVKSYASIVKSLSSSSSPSPLSTSQQQPSLNPPAQNANPGALGLPTKGSSELSTPDSRLGPSTVASTANSQPQLGAWGSGRKLAWGGAGLGMGRTAGGGSIANVDGSRTDGTACLGLAELGSGSNVPPAPAAAPAVWGGVRPPGTWVRLDSSGEGVKEDSKAVAAAPDYADISKQQHCDTRAKPGSTSATTAAGCGEERGERNLPVPFSSPSQTCLLPNSSPGVLIPQQQKSGTTTATKIATTPPENYSRPTGVQGHCSPAPSGNSAGGSRTREASAVSADDKTEDEGSGRKPARRRRPRRRRRRKSSKSGDGEEGSLAGGFLSDGMSGMERTISSSNISRTSDVTLYFEDELEFPEIGAAGGANSGGEGSVSCATPGLPSAAPPVSGGGGEGEGLAFVRCEDTWMPLSYSEILRRAPIESDVRSRVQSAPGSCLSGEEGGDENFNSQPGQGSSGHTVLSKRARKCRKRRELANRAAEAELAEISFEQQMLRELGNKVTRSRPSSGSREDKSPARGLITDPNVVKQSKGGGGGAGSAGGGKRLHQPMMLNIADMLDAFEKKKSMDQKGLVLGGLTKKRDDGKLLLSGNILDANAPSKRGKERETPKPKKPSPLKKVILKEREEKKRMRLIGNCDDYPEDIPDDPNQEDDPDPVDDSEQNLMEEADAGNPVGLGESDLSQDGLSSRSVDTDQGVSPGADLSPISQTSPLSMSPLTPGASPLSSPIAGYHSRDPVVLRIHSRRFREYCTQILDKDIDACCSSLLHELVRFQDRMYHKDPNKAKGKRRVVLGLREVTKHLKLKKIKCVIISPNLEKIQSKGGLDEALNNILTMCQEQNVPFVFALGRRALGRACAKLVPVSVAGIFNYDGCEEKFDSLISLTHKGREAYAEMVHAVEREIAENPPPPSLSAGSTLPSLYAHMGHSRTPSGCSAISFTSSVLSEPISENYPHAEPETDSKGYEIVRDQDGKVITAGSGSGVLAAGGHQNAVGGGVGVGGVGYSSASVDDFDDGNEADTEDFNECPRQKKKSAASSSSSGAGSMLKKVEDLKHAEKLINRVNCMEPHQGRHPPTLHASSTVVPVASCAPVPAVNRVNALGAAGGGGIDDVERSEDGDSVASESDSQRHLPPFDSIHSSAYDLSTEILSQHSSRTLDNLEALSNHSSRTLGDGSLTPNITDTGRERPPTPESSGGGRAAGRGGGVGGGLRLIDKERVQSWVESCLPEERDDECDDDDDREEDRVGAGGRESEEVGGGEREVGGDEEEKLFRA